MDLFYYKTKTDAKPRGKLSLEIGQTQIAIPKRVKEQPTDYVFEVDVGKRKLTLCADNREDMKAWVTHLKAKIINNEERIELSRKCTAVAINKVQESRNQRMLYATMYQSQVLITQRRRATTLKSTYNMQITEGYEDSDDD